MAKFGSGNKAHKLNYLRPAMNFFQNLARKQKGLATPALECHIFVEWTCLSLSRYYILIHTHSHTYTNNSGKYLRQGINFIPLTDNLIRRDL
jgi:hypothetical protein